MPLYEFRCGHCHEVSEFLMKMSDPNPKKCLRCDEGPLQKMMSQTNFRLKGTGWYETDFKDKKKSKDTKSVPAGKSAESSKSSPKETPQKTSSSTKSPTVTSTKSASPN